MALIASILSKFDDTGIKKAKHEFGGLKKIVGAIGIGAGLKQIGDLLLDAGKAAAADQKSMRLLNDQLVKNGHATKAQVKQNNKFIDTLSTQVGIVDDNLRPAMGKLVRATGSVSKAQDLLKLSLDASAVSGKPLDTVAQAMAKAFNGNTSALTRMFPELKKSKDLFGDLRREVSGAAVTQADPFSKLNVAMDNLKEKLGYIILPYVEQFVAEFTKPGGLGDQVSKFLDDLSNPKTEAGATFKQIKDAVKDTYEGVKQFFGLFGNGDAMKGFSNVASTLVKALPALLALKGIMFLAAAGKSVKSLVLALTAIRGLGGGGGTGTPAVVGGGGKGAGGKAVKAPSSGGLLGPSLFFTLGAQALLTGADISNQAATDRFAKLGVDLAAMQNSPTGKYRIRGLTTAEGLAWAQKNFPLGGQTNVTINVNGGDPKAVTNALQQYLKTNNGKVNTSGKFGK